MRAPAVARNITPDGAVEMLDDWVDRRGSADPADVQVPGQARLTPVDQVETSGRTRGGEGRGCPPTGEAVDRLQPIDGRPSRIGVVLTRVEIG